MKKWVIDIRFIVIAEEDWKASNELQERLPETDDVLHSYTPIRPVTEFTTNKDKETENETI